jgi:PKD repeat protein
MKLVSKYSIISGFWALAFGFILASDVHGVIVPDSRKIQWDPGVRGGVPIRTTIYTNLPTTATAGEIQTALNRCPSNQVVRLAAGTYNIASMIKIPSGVTLRGDGMGRTILKGQLGFSGSSVITFDNSFNSVWSAPARNLVSPQKGATAITTLESHGWTPGDIVLIDMLEQPNGDPPIDNTGSLGNCTWCGRATGTRPLGQWVKIVSVPSATTATIDPPLYWSYANTPQGVEMTGLTHYAGVEDLSLNNETSSARDTVTTFGAINCWLSGVAMIGNYRRAMWGYGALWFTMQKCHAVGGVPIGVDGAAQYTSDRAYGPFLGPHFSAGLITDSIFEKLTMGIAFEGAVSGNVFSYNVMTNIWWKNTGDAPRRFGPLMHGPHPFMNLIEGNYSAGRVRADEYWGTSSHFTVLRNRVIQVDRGTGDSQNWTVDVERRNWYWSFVGNLMGGGGGVNEDQYELSYGEAAPYSSSSSAIWKLGYKSLGEDADLYDTGTVRTMIRWGNWTYRTNDSVAGSGVVFHTNNVADPLDFDIPDSYYLATRPAFFGSLRWPPYDPANPSANSLTNIPAGYRYAFGIDPPNGPVNHPPSVNATASPMSGPAPLQVAFNCNASDPEGASLTYQWTFGDGTTSTVRNPSKTYSAEGSFTAYVRVSDGTNVVQSSNLAIFVGNRPPVVAASSDVTSGALPLTVQFSSAGSSDPEGAPLQYNWTFGDGTTSTAANPVHTYNQQGIYTVRLDVSDGQATVTSAPISITVFNSTDGLVAAYPLEEGSGTGTADAAGNNNTGTISAATWRVGRFGNALGFNGTNSVVTAPDSGSLDLTSGMTVMAWLYPTALGGARNVVYKDSSSYFLSASTTESTAPAVGVSFGTALQGPNALPLNTWSHVAGTFDGTTLALYVNGVQVASRAQTGSITPGTGPLMIGGNAFVAGKHFAGSIDEVRIFNRALSASEVSQSMQSAIIRRPNPPEDFQFASP